MKYEKKVLLKDQTPCLLKSVGEEDAEEVLRSFLLAHGETDFLASYPEENTNTVEKKAAFLKETEENPRALELGAFIDGHCVGTAGFEGIGSRFKYLHRAGYGISIEKAYWGKGLGKVMTEVSIALAKEAGYEQMELQVVADNARAIHLYQSLGFEEFGRNPLGMKSKLTGEYQCLIHMRKVLSE